jgi:hypothetical protein
MVRPAPRVLVAPRRQVPVLAGSAPSVPISTAAVRIQWQRQGLGRPGSACTPALTRLPVRIDVVGVVLQVLHLRALRGGRHLLLLGGELLTLGARRSFPSFGRVSIRVDLRNLCECARVARFLSPEFDLSLLPSSDSREDQRDDHDDEEDQKYRQEDVHALSFPVIRYLETSAANPRSRANAHAARRRTANKFDAHAVGTVGVRRSRRFPDRDATVPVIRFG